MTYLVSFLFAYLFLVYALRFQRLRSLHRRYSRYATRESLRTMTSHDAWAIQKEMLQLEFPTIALKSLQFALFRTYGIPTISSLLSKTSQLSCPMTVLKRYADTSTLIGEFMAFPPESDRALTAIARTHVLHSGYRAHGSIREDDMLYTLSLFATEPIRFIERYEWRGLTDLEKCAIGTYWMGLGEAMGISYEKLPSKEKKGFQDGLQWLQEIADWSQGYEEQNMRPEKSNQVVADQTMEVVVYGMPGFLRPAGWSFASFVMDERLRRAMMYDPPSSFASTFFNTIVLLRKYILRYLTLPRPYFMRHDVFSESPDPNTGRHFIIDWSAAPYYVRPTVWNRWGPAAWMRWIMGLPLPGDQGGMYFPEGYNTPDLGPKYFQGKGRERMEQVKEALKRR